MERFEDIVAWQKARELTAQVYRVSQQQERLRKDFGLRDQMLRAAISMMANIAEGFERGRLSEFHQFLSVSKASCAELRSHLYVALDAGYLDAEEFEVLRLKAEEVGRILGGPRQSVERKRDGS
jgi:four helix bundle protein